MASTHKKFSLNISTNRYNKKQPDFQQGTSMYQQADRYVDGGHFYSSCKNSPGGVPTLIRSSSTGNLELNLDLPLTDHEDETSLTHSLQNLSAALTKLKAVVSPQPSPEISSESLRLDAHSKLGDVITALQNLLQKHHMLKSGPILTAAASLIDKIKNGSFDGSSQDTEEFLGRIDQMASILTNSISEYWMAEEFGSFSNGLSVRAKSMDCLASLDQKSESGLSGLNQELPAGSSDVILNKIESGVEMALHRAQAWSKYTKDLIAYVERRNNLWGEFARNLSKLAKSVEQSINEDSFLPFQPLFCKALSQDMELCSMGQAARSLIQNQTFVAFISSRRAEHEKIRKELKSSWSKQVRKMADAEGNLRKAKSTYISRQQDHDRMKDQAQKAETESLSQSAGASSTKADAKAKKKKVPTATLR